MKTRIISGTVLVFLLIAVTVLSLYFPVILVAAMAILCGIAVLEMLFSTGICKNKPIVFSAVVYAFLYPFFYMYAEPLLKESLTPVFIGMVFIVLLKVHSHLTVKNVAGAMLFPIILAKAFSAVVSVAQFGKNGLLYFILLFCWSSVADTGAYFVGVLFGKHKMAPVISPKKSWEGFVGGVVFGILGAIAASLIYSAISGNDCNIINIAFISPVFVLLGILGDLSASIIKRQCDIKDFGNIIPGHGGILDRFDSILMIAPFFELLLSVAK